MTSKPRLYNIRHVVLTALVEAPPAPGRRERRVAETRRAIAQAAKELFEERGYGETTIDQIADRADVATRTLFRYFASKEALLFADFDEWRGQLVADLESRPHDEAPLCSVAIALTRAVARAEELRPQIDRAMRLAEEHEAVAAYKRGVAQAESANAVAQFIASRLGVDPAVDVRPEAWAAMMIGAFGTTMRSCQLPNTPFDGDPVATLAALLSETSAALLAAANVLITGDADSLMRCANEAARPCRSASTSPASPAAGAGAGGALRTPTPPAPPSGG